MAERIICAAIYWDDGKVHVHAPSNVETGWVICGRRHHNIIPILTGLGKPQSNHAFAQGFMTSEDRFVGREEAARIFRATVGEPNDLKKLYSEDLY